MRFARLLLPLALTALAACALRSNYSRIRIEIPSSASVPMDDFQEIIVADFLLTAPAQDVDLNKELTAYFQTELGIRFKGTVSRRSLSPDKEDLLQNEAFWKESAAGGKGLLFLTGKARLEQEIRKALLEKNRGSAEDPFAKEKTWDERKSFTLLATLVLIDGGTGRPVFEKEYKEVATYVNPRQPAAFALFDLLQRLKAKFFRSVFGTDRLQERYILFR